MVTDRLLDLVVVTPERQLLAEKAASVVIPMNDGELGILHLRAPLICTLGIGQLRYDHDGATRRLFIDGGFAQVFDDKVTVLTPRAIPVEEITPAVVQAAEAKLADLTGDERSQQQRRISVLKALQPPRI